MPSFEGPHVFGSREHFFHFMFGYLLPGLEHWVRCAPDKTGIFLTCGPVMNSLIMEACSLLGLQVSIESFRPEGKPLNLKNKIVCARWDCWLTEPVRMSRLDRFGGLSPWSVRSRMQRIRLLFLNRTGALKANSSEDLAGWLLLRRSPEHEFYRQGGAAQIPGYGTGRCAIGNIEALAEGLIDAGIPIQVYEPGRHSLEDQIRVFHGAKGVLGIRGAEFANLLWMRSGSQALMMATPVEQENHASRHLAKVGGIDFTAVKVDSFHPSVSVIEVLRAIRRSGK